MREITDIEAAIVNGGLDLQGYTFNFVIGNALTGACIGILFPGISITLGLTTYIANPVLATSALFATYAFARMGASILDQTLFSSAESASIPPAMTV